MTRSERAKLLTDYINRLNIDLSDLPRNENRFTVSAIMADRGYMADFYLYDNVEPKNNTSFSTRWYTLKAKNSGYIVGMDIIDRINSWIVDIREV